MAAAMSSAALEVYNEVRGALLAEGMTESDVVFDSANMPTTTKHRAFRIVPGEIDPESFGKSIVVGITLEVAVAYAKRPGEETETVTHEILPDLDGLMKRVVALKSYAGPIGLRVEQDSEAGRYLALILSVRMEYCLERS